MQSSTMQSRAKQTSGLALCMSASGCTFPAKTASWVSDGCNWKWLKLHSVLLLLTSLLCKSSSTILLTSLLCKTAVQDRFLFVRLCVRKKTFLRKSRFLPFWHFFALDQTTWHRRTPVQVPSWFSAQQDDKTRPKAPSD